MVIEHMSIDPGSRNRWNMAAQDSMHLGRAMKTVSRRHSSTLPNLDAVTQDMAPLMIKEMKQHVRGGIQVSNHEQHYFDVSCKPIIPVMCPHSSAIEVFIALQI
jgi:hypothetical protein